MTPEMDRQDLSDWLQAQESDGATPLPDDAVAAILATNPDVTVNELLRARAKARRLLAIYRAGAIQAAQNPIASR
jgi:hypothetical protein